jgi:hypothetical protein
LKPTRRQETGKYSDAPSPAEGGNLRPEDVVIEEMNEAVGGIIIAGTRKPKDEAKPK